MQMKLYFSGSLSSRKSKQRASRVPEGTGGSVGSGLQRPELRQVTKKAVLPGRAEEQRPAQALLGGVRLY